MKSVLLLLAFLFAFPYAFSFDGDDEEILLYERSPAGAYFDYGEYELKERKFERPLREISLIASDEGYFPNQVSVFQDERVRIFLTTLTAKQSCFLLPEQNVFLAANPGRITETEIVFKTAGTFKFHCPSGKISGRITVIGKNVPKNSRVIASEKVKKAPKVWMPREYPQ